MDGTHAYAISRDLAGELADFLTSALCGIDVSLRMVSMTHRTFRAEPSLASQAPSFSDIEGISVPRR